MAGKVTWFPGHMHKALKAMHKQLKAVDMVIEVRDARVPWSAANPEFDALLGNKRKHLVFNKVDLIPACARMVRVNLSLQPPQKDMPIPTPCLLLVYVHRHSCNVSTTMRRKERLPYSTLMYVFKSGIEAAVQGH